jgi:transcriptional regulator with XRE-family HTH domain
MQKITTPGRETMVILPLEEYEHLIDAADIALADRVSAAIATGEDELVPSEIVDRLLGGENPVKVWREHRGLSARQLATAADLSPAYLSEIETGRKDGSVAVLKKIARALAVDLDADPDVPQRREVGRVEGVQGGGADLDGAVAAQELAVEAEEDLGEIRHAGDEQGADEIASGVVAQLADRDLRAGRDHGLGQSLEHERERRGLAETTLTGRR